MGSEDRDDPAYPEALGRTIRVYRAARDLARRELAEQAEISYSYLAEIEKGSKYPSAKALHAIAKALGLSPAELLTAAETLETPGEVAAAEDLEERSAAVAGSAFRSYSPDPEGARARQKLWFHTELPALASKPARKPAQQDLRLSHDWEPQLDKLLAQLRELMREMLPEDRQHVLELARRLAKR
jgi:transcriptional regulator with XRE-family HTH domain